MIKKIGKVAKAKPSVSVTPFRPSMGSALWLCCGWLLCLPAAGAAVVPPCNAGADVNRQNANGFTPLMGAVLAGNESAVLCLLDAGADPNLMDQDGETALLEASRRGHTAVVRRLLAGGADPYAHHDHGTTALAVAASAALAQPGIRST